MPSSYSVDLRFARTHYSCASQCPVSNVISHSSFKARVLPSKIELGCQLNDTRAVRACGYYLAKVPAGEGRNWSAKVCLIRKIKSFPPYLQRHRFPNPKIPDQGKVESEISRTLDIVKPEVPVVACGWVSKR